MAHASLGHSIERSVRLPLRSSQPGLKIPGPQVLPQGVHHRVWSLDHSTLQVEIHPASGGPSRLLPLTPLEGGWHEVIDPDGLAGDRYQFVLPDGTRIADPASRFQPEGVHGPSQVLDDSGLWWTDQAWRRPAFRSLVLYELHVGTFTPEGTFRAAIEKLEYLADLGITAIELMPVAAFAGARNWGYDGVLLWAVHHTYGTPDDLRALVNAAHQHHIAVILDVVYNHLGPDGNPMPGLCSHYFKSDLSTLWGSALNYDGPHCGPVRDFFVLNACHWLDSFHIDGLRLDATHAIHDRSTPHILTEIVAEIHARGCYAIAEDNRNDARLCEPEEAGGHGFDAVWADDFHHALRVSQTHETGAWFADYQGTVEELHEILSAGWLYQGQHSESVGGPRGTPCRHLAPTAFLTCLSNHDQAGNRALGERLHQSISPAAYRALSVLLCLAPYTPMLFMGQEWAASSPFLYFTDHTPELGALITQGRRGEFAGFPEFSDPAALDRIPDPQAPDTFARSQLKWEERTAAHHAGMLQLYRECLRLRRQIPLLNHDPRRAWRTETLPGGILVLHYDGPGRSHSLLIHLEDKPAILPVVEICPQPETRLLLSSNEARFGGEREALSGLPACPLHLSGPEVVLVAR